MKKLISIVLFTSVLSGCANGYKDFYYPANPSTLAQINQNRITPPPQVPAVERVAPSGNTTSLLDVYIRKGFAYIGSSSFNSGTQESDAGAIQQAQKVGADLVVILVPRHTGTTTTAIPITTPTTSTSYSTGNATAYGAGGVVNAYGSGTTTTYGSTTNMVPVTINRMDYGAFYFVKQRAHFGVVLRDLNDQERKELQTNRGSVIRLIIDDTPAYRADLLAGDIITTVNGVQVDGTSSLLNLFRTLHNIPVPIDVMRDGKKITKVVQLVD